MEELQCIFENIEKKLYHNAKHGLCIYHLVTKGLEKLGSNLLQKDITVAKDMIATFKHWVFSWMSLGGVETEEEFQSSLALLCESGYMKCNAMSAP